MKNAHSTPLKPLVCKHCGLSLLDYDTTDEFCCNGCRLIYSTIHSLGFERFYTLRERANVLVSPRPDDEARKSFSYLDDPSVVDMHTAPQQGGKSIVFFVPSLHCIACVWLLERLPEIQPGLCSVKVHLARREVSCLVDTTCLAISSVAELLSSLGYSPSLTDAKEKDELSRRAEVAALSRIGVAAFCLGNIMILSVSLYEAEWSGMAPTYRNFFSYLCGLLSVPALVYSARPFFMGFGTKLLAGALHLDMLIALSLSAAFGLSCWHLVTGEGPIYFDSIVALIFFLQIGRYLQQRAVHYAELRSRRTTSLLPLSANVWDGERVHETPLHLVKVGMQVSMRSGERLPVDGLVLQGSCEVDESILSGESVPRVKEPGSTVFAGSRIVEGEVLVEALSVGPSTRLASLLSHLQEEPDSEPWSFEKYATWALLMFLLSCTLAIIVLVGGDSGELTSRLLALAVVLCPCAIGLARPTTCAMALSRATEAGIFFRDVSALFRIPKIKHVLFDKTGTLTTGELEVSTIELAEELTDLHVVESVLKRSSSVTPYHPVSRALLHHFKGGHAEMEGKVEVFSGRGVKVQDGQEVWRVGSERWMNEEGILTGGKMVTSGDARVWVSKNGTLVAVVGIRDDVRPGMRELISFLQRRGVKCLVVSGDTPQRAQEVADMVGISTEQAFGGQYPEQKQELVRGLPGETMMIGDGVNDKLALQAASVGVAVQGGLECIVEGIPVYISCPSGSVLTDLFEGADRTVQSLRLSYALSLFYNLVAGIGAVTGLVTPLIAAVLMPLSSLSVVLIGLCSKTFVERAVQGERIKSRHTSTNEAVSF